MEENAHQLLRIDREIRQPIGHDTELALLRAVEPAFSTADAVLISDYGKGTCTRPLLRGLIDMAKSHEIPLLVDPARGADYEQYMGATALIPNRLEAAKAWGHPIESSEDALAAASDLALLAGTRGALIKLDRDGMAFAFDGRQPQHFPARSHSVFDTTGAGDMVLAALGLGLAGGLDWDDVIRFSNIAAGLEIERIGVAAVTRAELNSQLLGGQTLRNESIISEDRLLELVAEYRQLGKTIALTNGCFDVLHAGHVTYLKEASQLADVLIVAINSDAEVRRQKGFGQPLMDATSRATVLASLASVSHVVVFDNPTPRELLRRIRPDVLVKGGDYTLDEVVGSDIVREYGGRVSVTTIVQGMSTTNLIDKMASNCASTGPRHKSL